MVGYELKDPRLGLVTVTRVEVTPDLGHARVHVGITGTEAERKKSLEALRRAAGFVRRELAQRLAIRQVPEVDFRIEEAGASEDGTPLYAIYRRTKHERNAHADHRL